MIIRPGPETRDVFRGHARVKVESSRVMGTVQRSEIRCTWIGRGTMGSERLDGGNLASIPFEGGLSVWETGVRC